MGDDGRGRGTCTVFEGTRQIAQGAFIEAVAAAKVAFDQSHNSSILVFEDTTGDLIDVDYGGTPAEVLHRATARDARKAAADAVAQTDAPTRGAGRPRLGVVAREVTLLPRHWQWLNGQPGGASAALRRLVDEARRTNIGRDRVRRAQEVAYRFMVALAGDLAGFEEAIRALFAGDLARFDHEIENWPGDVSRYARQLAAPAFATRPEA